LVKVTAALQADPQNPAAYVGRGNIYTAEKLWNQAARDYRKALQLTPQAVPIQFDLAELDFMQGKYDIARPGFVVVQQNPYMSDLASYKIFLCDLLDGNEQLAGRELAAFNQVGANASYYFANAAWSLNHEKKDEAKHWLTAAARLYPPDLIKVYTASLIEIGSLDASGTPPKTTVFRLLN
jgi:tetratricopeptide (TPR) repeat protein